MDYTGTPKKYKPSMRRQQGHGIAYRCERKERAVLIISWEKQSRTGHHSDLHVQWTKFQIGSYNKFNRNQMI
jgi:hypothetical protein